MANRDYNSINIPELPNNPLPYVTIVHMTGTDTYRAIFSTNAMVIREVDDPQVMTWNSEDNISVYVYIEGSSDNWTIDNTDTDHVYSGDIWYYETYNAEWVWSNTDIVDESGAIIYDNPDAGVTAPTKPVSEFDLRSWLAGYLFGVSGKKLPILEKLPANYPTMAAGKTWCKDGVGGWSRYITEINFAKYYEVTGNETRIWAADVDDSGSIMCYVNNDTVLTICSMGADKIMANEDSSGMFKYFEDLTAIYGLNMLDTSKVTDMNSMFMECNSIVNLDLNSFDTSKVTNMCYMFYYCDSLLSINLSSFDTSKVTNMCYMFHYCEVLKSLDLSSFDTNNVTRTDHMFFMCRALTKIYVGSGWTTANVIDTTDMFYKCGVSSVTYV